MFAGMSTSERSELAYDLNAQRLEDLGYEVCDHPRCLDVVEEGEDLCAYHASITRQEPAR